MADKFTDVSNTSFLSRIGGAIAGFFIGPILVIAAIVLLSWNEGRAVQAIRALGEASQVAVESQPNNVLPTNDGKLVHVIGSATASAAIADPDLGVNFANQVTVSRQAEMYQWREKEQQETHDKLGGGQETVTTYTYEKVWSDDAIDSSQFKHPEGHENPEMAIKSSRYAADDAKLGGYTLDGATLGLIDLSTNLSPDAPDGWKKVGDKLYKGDSNAPNVGDERVSYQGLPSGATISVLAQQSQNGFAPFITGNGYKLDMAETGNQPLANMIAEKKGEESMLTWILRLVGFVLIFAGFAMFLSPLSTFASVVPILGSIVGGAAALAAFVVALPLTLIVIALSWVAFRPLIGIGLLVVAGGLLYGLRRWHHANHPPELAKAAKA
ncbi:MAG TPA: TMEM43 family protein [Rhizomicrobium sp.]